ncbi:MAG: HAMP domain-containing protein [Anaerolineales bacterium]|nr:HAMP domain-containing protein [Chloroflexota bacterium]MBL6979554.1 HAMP domain-containing protein [Anaerolineales bacterium]
MTRRLLLAFSFVVLITIVSLVVIVRLNTAQTVRTFMFRGGMAGVESLVSELEEHYTESGSWHGSDQVFRGAPGPGQGGPGSGMKPGMGMRNEEMMGQHIRLVDLDGNVVLDNLDDEGFGHVEEGELEYAIPLEVAGQEVGYLLAEGGQLFTTENEQALLSRLNRAAFTAAVIAGGVSLILALLLSYSLLRPVRDLTKAASQMAEGDLSQRVRVRGDKPLATLGVAFNRMAVSLQQAGDRRQALTADIAHELRTPLAVQRAHLEALQDGIYDLTSENLVPIEEQNRALTRLVEDLRTLALADGGQLTLERTSTDFTALLERLISRFDPQAAAQGVEIALSPMGAPAFVEIDPQRVEQILNNLLSNALRYSPDGGVISVQCSVTSKQLGVERKLITENWLLITVKDTGPGIPKESLPHIFERFYKADRSRTSVEGGSTGLGLSIAQKLAQAHGGDITAENHPNGGAIFTLTLPIN